MVVNPVQLLPTSQSSAEKTAIDEAEKKTEVPTSYVTMTHLYFVMSWLKFYFE